MVSLPLGQQVASGGHVHIGNVASSWLLMDSMTFPM